LGRTAAIRGTGVVLAALAGALLLCLSAAAQQGEPAAPAGSAAAPPASQEPSPSYRPGFLEALGRWLGSSKSAIDSQLGTGGEVLGGLRSKADDAAKQAAGAIVGLPGTRVVSGRETCALAQNGAPDCGAAAEALCRGKGFTAGQSLEINSAHKCSAWVWLSGRVPDERQCSLETYVTRAVCR